MPPSQRSVLPTRRGCRQVFLPCRRSPAVMRRSGSCTSRSFLSSAPPLTRGLAEVGLTSKLLYPSGACPIRKWESPRFPNLRYADREFAELHQLDAGLLDSSHLVRMVRTLPAQLHNRSYEPRTIVTGVATSSCSLGTSSGVAL